MLLYCVVRTAKTGSPHRLAFRRTVAQTLDQNARPAQYVRWVGPTVWSDRPVEQWLAVSLRWSAPLRAVIFINNATARTATTKETIIKPNASHSCLLYLLRLSSSFFPFLLLLSLLLPLLPLLLLLSLSRHSRHSQHCCCQ